MDITNKTIRTINKEIYFNLSLSINTPKSQLYGVSLQDHEKPISQHNYPL